MCSRSFPFLPAKDSSSEKRACLGGDNRILQPFIILIIQCVYESGDD